MLFNFVYKTIRKLAVLPILKIDKFFCFLIFKGNNVHFSSFRTKGKPYVVVAIGGKCTIGKNFKMNNGIQSNPIGCYAPCTLFVGKGAQLTIGNNVGISQTALICHHSISIGNNVKCGGGVKIYDTDFHSLNPQIRASKDDQKDKKKLPVVIEDNVFIGAYSIILKGVTIGKNSIVGAGSVVTKSIPANEIWAGNPASFIRK
jgi:acetyltransferase-like isoleucine patch superfamily enzyme